MMLTNMLGFVLALAGPASQTSDVPDIRVELGGQHWNSCRDADLRKLQAGFIRLSKVGLVSLREACEQYVQGKCPSDGPVKKNEHTVEWPIQERSIDVAVLNRLVFPNKLKILERFDLGQVAAFTAGPVWTFKNGVPTLHRCSLPMFSWDHVDALVEFDVLWHAK